MRERRREAGVSDLEPSKAEPDYASVMHGGIYYCGLRKLIRENGGVGENRFVIEAALDVFRAQLDRVSAG